MDTIVIEDLEVSCRVGVTDAERVRPQTVRLTLQIERNLAPAAASDDLADTTDYFALAQRLLHFGDDRHWNLIETLASDVASLVLDEFNAARVTVEVKKYVIPQARHVAVRLTRPV
jgi:7,8-dihydroneopterin aldolase/epimerase/oxygenase